MWYDEYLRDVTRLVRDPVKATEIYQELRAHLEEVKAEVMAGGVEPETAEAVALTRMGPAEKLALSLAEAHHRHLPWRHYLAVVPVACLLVTLTMWGERGGKAELALWWVLLLLICLFPSRAVWPKLYNLVLVDIRSKLAWLQGQPVRAAAIAGALTGAVTCVALITALTGGHPNRLPMVLFVTAAPTLLGILWMRWRYQVPVFLTAAFAALGFSAVCLPFVLFQESTRYGLVIWVTISAVYTLGAMALGWATQFAERQGWLSRAGSPG
jgi:hypothetical protein